MEAKMIVHFVAEVRHKKNGAHLPAWSDGKFSVTWYSRPRRWI